MHASDILSCRALSRLGQRAGVWGPLALLLALAPPLHAQLVSPGKLSSAHASLEGVGSCTKCHDFGSNTFRRNCLACHGEIRTRIERGLGYHSFTKKLECATCHKEHHGRDFKLIRWDPAKFDHRQAGFVLDGKHAGRQCRDCHTPKNIVQAEIRKKSTAAQQRSYLGLEPSCANCHRDVHSGQLGKDCASCHGAAGWETTTFNHAKARFPLAGRHASVPCARCHTRGDGDAPRFKGIAHGRCLDCHEDTQHKGAFGNECATCHSPAGWKQVRLAQGNFDHAKTAFPLEGRHAQLTCARCHSGGSMRNFEGKELSKCRSCHADAHGGQFDARPDGGECSACHNVSGFAEVRFESAQHDSTRFPLTNAHGAVPCRSCHVADQHGGTVARRFRWDGLACTSCHADPHAAQFTDRIAREGCTSCHSSTNWHAMVFDHERTRFSLQGRHRSVPCARCHVEGDVAGTRTIVYRLAHDACVRCHHDPHRAQFADDTGSTECARCHDVEGWIPPRFDHASARFPLAGRHAGLPCTSCHPAEATADGSTLRRFKPLDTRCEACHHERKE